jgi:CheY-like chemotaxis protein
MRILIAEDEIDTAIQYKIALEDRNHTVTLAMDGDECLSIYKKAMNDNSKCNDYEWNIFDVVVLDYRMPKTNGMNVAKEILALNPKQRMIFASAYVKETLFDSIKQLRHVVELIQKPFELDTLISMIEDENAYKKIQELNEYLKELDDFDITQEQVEDLLDSINKIT